MTIAFTERGRAQAFDSKELAHGSLPAETWFVVDGPEELVRTLVPREWADLVRRLEIQLSPKERLDLDGSFHSQKAVMRLTAQRVWDALKVATGDPTLADTSKEPAMAKEAAAAAEKSATIPDGLNAKDKIRFGVDKEGKPYAANKPPYREGSKRAERFALIRSGMSVEKALEAGLTGRQIKQMVEREHIVLDKAA